MNNDTLEAINRVKAGLEDSKEHGMSCVLSAEEVEELLDFISQSIPKERLMLPTKMKKHYVQVCYQRGDPPFICGAIGHFTADVMDEIEKQILEDYEDCFNIGDGDYLFEVSHESAQTGEYGMIEVPAYWLLTEVLFEAIGSMEGRGNE